MPQKIIHKKIGVEKTIKSKFSREGVTQEPLLDGKNVDYGYMINLFNYEKLRVKMYTDMSLDSHLQDNIGLYYFWLNVMTSSFSFNAFTYIFWTPPFWAMYV